MDGFLFFLKTFHILGPTIHVHTNTNYAFKTINPILSRGAFWPAAYFDPK